MVVMQHTVNMVQVVEYLTGKGVSKEEALEVQFDCSVEVCVYYWFVYSSTVKWTEMEKGR